MSPRGLCQRTLRIQGRTPYIIRRPLKPGVEQPAMIGCIDNPTPQGPRWETPRGQDNPPSQFTVEAYMPIKWTAFEECVNDRIAYYQQQYDEATRVYRRLLKDGVRSNEQIEYILGIQQLAADELSRLNRLQRKYAQKLAVIVFDPQIIQIEPIRLN